MVSTETYAGRVLVMLSFCVLFLASFLAILAGNGPLGQLNPDPVGTGLNHNGAVLHGAHSAGNAANAGNLSSPTVREFLRFSASFFRLFSGRIMKK